MKSSKNKTFDSTQKIESLRKLLAADGRILSAGHKDHVDLNVDSETRRLVNHLSLRTNYMIASIVQLAVTLEDIDKTIRMISRYPWHGTSIDRVSHLELTWFLFQNLCYKFKEKLKLVYNYQKTVASLLDFQKPEWLRFELKEVDRILGEEIRNRGDSVHNWNVKNSKIDFFSMVYIVNEFKSAGEQIDLPEGFFNVRGHYLDTKHELKRSAISMYQESEAILLRVLEKHEPLPIWILNKTSDVLDSVNAGKITLSTPRKMV